MPLFIIYPIVGFVINDLGELGISQSIKIVWKQLDISQTQGETNDETYKT